MKAIKLALIIAALPLIAASADEKSSESINSDSVSVYTSNFEKTTPKSWSLSTKETKVEVLKAENENKTARLRFFGNCQKIGGNIFTENIKVTADMAIQLSFKCKSQSKINYIAFAFVINNKLYWLWCGKLNAIGNPVQDKWLSAWLSLKSFKTKQGVEVANGDVISSFMFVLVAKDTGMQSFEVRNIKIIKTSKKYPVGAPLTWKTQN